MSERKKGAALALVAAGVYAAIAFFTTPVLVAAFGLDGFGRYSLALSVLAAFMLFDGGLTQAFVRFAVRHREDGPPSLAAFLGRVLPLYGVAVAALLGCALGAAALLGEAAEGMGVLLSLALAGAACAILANPFRATMVASERFVAARTIEIAAAVVTAAGSITVALTGGGPTGAMAVVTAGMAGLAVTRIFYVLFVLELRPRPATMERSERRALMAFAAPIFLSLLIEALYWRIDILVVGAMLGPASVAIYAVALMVQKHMMRLSGAFSRVMIPETIRKVDAGADGKALARALAAVGRVQAIALGLVLIAICAFGDAFFALWLGEAFRASFVPLVVVLVPYCIDEVGNLRNVVLQTKGLFWAKALQSLLIALANLAATVALIPVFGIVGAASATACGLMAGLAASNWLLARRAGFEVALFYRTVAVRVAPTLVVATLWAAMIDSLAAESWAGLFAATIVYGVGAACSIWVLSLREAERAAVRSRAAGAARSALATLSAMGGLRLR
ncbi:MAG: oligosaccharide flippase family protein [Pseudomonadota bacterium]